MAITIVFPQIFPGNPWRSMEKFLRHLRQLPAITNTCDGWEHHRIFQTHRDHPAGTPASNWMSTWFADDRGNRHLPLRHVRAEFKDARRSEGSSVLVPITMDWYVDPLFVPTSMGPWDGHRVHIYEHRKALAAGLAWQLLAGWGSLH